MLKHEAQLAYLPAETLGPIKPLVGQRAVDNFQWLTVIHSAERPGRQYIEAWQSDRRST